MAFRRQTDRSRLTRRSPSVVVSPWASGWFGPGFGPLPGYGDRADWQDHYPRVSCTVHEPGASDDGQVAVARGPQAKRKVAR